MDRVASVLGKGFVVPGSSQVATSSTRTTSIRASAATQPLILKVFSELNKLCVILMFATTCLSTISAHASKFRIDGTSYKCGVNIICLGQAHEYTMVDSKYPRPGIQTGRLSLIQEPDEFSTSAKIVSGIAYYYQPVRLKDPSTNLSASFSTCFSMNIFQVTYRNHPDGIAFVINADNRTLGEESEMFGIFNSEGLTIKKSIVVEFDGYQDTEYPVYDISDNHVSFDFSNITTTVAANASGVGVQVWNNVTTYAWVEYSHETQQLEVRVSKNMSRPGRPLLNYTVNLSEVVEEYMWIGFSAGGGNFSSNYYVGDWTFESRGPPVYSSRESSYFHCLNLTKKTCLGMIIGAAVGFQTVFLLACICIVVIVLRRFGRRNRRRSSFVEEDPIQLEGMPERFSYNQLRVATNDFSEASKLGQGGSGSVYRGDFPPSSTPMAVKKIHSSSTQGEKEFMAEASIISQLRHRNLIQLLGWCKDVSKGNYLLVYELMPNGSLDKVLFGSAEEPGSTSLSWPQRFHIVTGTAAALDYLHQGWKQQVIHRDIKSSNIMLDKDWNAKLGDFGLARLVDHEQTPAKTMVAGTVGYIAPEVAATGRFTVKTDVYAFGAVVLEIACGRKVLSRSVPPPETVLVEWVRNCLREGELLSTVDKRLSDYETRWMEVLLMVGLLCTHPDPLARPSMRHVVRVLAGEASMPSIPESTSTPAFSSDSLRHSLDDLHSLINILTADINQR